MKYSAIAWPRTFSARCPHWVLRAAKRQRGHLKGRGPPLASLVQQREVAGGDMHTEVRQQRPALSHRRRALHDVIAGTAVICSWDARAARLRFLSGK